MPPSACVSLPFGGEGSISFDGPEDLLAVLERLVPFCPDTFRADLRLRVVFGEPELAHEPAAPADLDLFLADQGDDFLLFAIRDLRRQLETRPTVYLRLAREEPESVLYLADPDAYHRKLGKWFLVGLLATVGGLRFAHASAVGDGSSVALILGPHGSGKSTLAAAAVVAGLDLLAEGVALVDGGGRLIPFFMDGEPLLRLGAEAWREVRPRLPEPDADPERYPSRAGGVAEKVVLRLRDLFPGTTQSDRPMPIAAAWLPRIAGDGSGKLAIDSLPRREVLAEVGDELEDRRIRSLRAGLSGVRWLDSARPGPESRWQQDFPPRSLRVHGIEDFATLVSRLEREGVGLGA
jgi:hypothetical protein